MNLQGNRLRWPDLYRDRPLLWQRVALEMGTHLALEVRVLRKASGEDDGLLEAQQRYLEVTRAARTSTWRSGSSSWSLAILRLSSI
jgi:hypothetical protein